jgi:predicted DNA-binding transcriptional regulator AlpA|tara:strand:+ start:799 stop:1017 length:219 start_codon:yes stop_codon:yes gene_type:complete
MSKLNIENELVSENTLSKILDVSFWTLRYWRAQKKGPKYIKLENGRVRYPKKDIDDWYANQTKTENVQEERG